MHHVSIHTLPICESAPMPKTILITGASSGIGKTTARLFQQRGWNVVASMRSPDKEEEMNQLDNVLFDRR